MQKSCSSRSRPHHHTELLGWRKDQVTLLEVCPSTPSDQQGISSKGHALVIQDKGDTAWGVARAGPSLQGLAGMQSTESVTSKLHQSPPPTPQSPIQLRETSRQRTRATVWLEVNLKSGHGGKYIKRDTWEAEAGRTDVQSQPEPSQDPVRGEVSI